MSQPASRVVYDAGFPWQVAAPSQNVQTQQDNIGQTAWNAPEPKAGIEYIDQTVGGRTGTVIRNGFSTGLSPYLLHKFFGNSPMGVMRNLAKDGGPVGRDNSTNVLQAGVAQQQTVWPSQAEIYASISRGR